MAGATTPTCNARPLSQQSSPGHRRRKECMLLASTSSTGCSKEQLMQSVQTLSQTLYSSGERRQLSPASGRERAVVDVLWSSKTPRDRWRLVKNVMKAVWAFKTHTHSVRTLKIQSHLDQWKTRAIDTSESKAWWIIEPGSTLRLVWDTTTSFLMLVMVFYVPYHVSFVRSSMAYDVFDQVVTVWFTVDIVLSFITAYEKDGVLVTRPEKIAFHYLRTFFLIDLVATVPWEVLFDETSAGKIAEYGRLSKAAKIPRLLRYVRAVKFFRTTYGGSAEGQIYGFYARMNPGILSLGRIVLTALVGAHLIACIWYKLGTSYVNEDLQPEDCISLYYQHSDRSRRSKHCTWLQASGYKEGDGHFFLYTVSLYWSLTVISTVGFGDYTPLNSHEKLYTCFVIVAGVACYSLIISSVAKIFDSRDKTSTLEWRTRVLNRFVHKYRIPTYLAFALHSHNQRHFEMGHHWRNEANEASKLIESLSRPLYRILALHLEEKLITQIPFFRGKPNAFVADAVVLLTPLLAVSGETILNMGSVADALHLIISGSISIRKPDDNVTRELGAMKKGSYFGDEGCLLNAVFIGDLDAVDSVSFELITRDSLHKLLDSFPNVRESLVQTAKYRLKFSGILRVRRDAQQAQRLLIDDGTTRSIGSFLLKHREHVSPKIAFKINKLRGILCNCASEDSKKRRAPKKYRIVASQASYLMSERLDAQSVSTASELPAETQRDLLNEFIGLLGDDEDGIL